MVYKRKSSDIGKSTSELAKHTSKSIRFAQIDLKINNADVEKTRKVEIQQIENYTFPKHPKSLKSVHKTILAVVANPIHLTGEVPTNNRNWQVPSFIRRLMYMRETIKQKLNNFG